jgi:hypothetical protein
MSKVIVVMAFILALPHTVAAQDQCVVLMESISDRYEGECKKGLAHGQGEAWGIDHYTGSFKKGLPNGMGTYEYTDGSVYEGMWSKGLRHGTGKLTFKFNDTDSIQQGLWDDDKFIGDKETSQGYSIVMKRAIERYRIYRYSDGNEIRVHLKPLDSGTLEVSNLQITGSSGHETPFLNSQMEFRNCDYPFRLRVSFKKWSKLKTVRVDTEFEVVILKPGVWLIEIGA